MDKQNLPCKFGRHFSDSVPYGSTWISMPGFECDYDGDKEPLECCEENDKCPCYEPVETKICKKHIPNTRYYGICPTCEAIAEKKMEEEEEHYAKASKGE